MKFTKKDYIATYVCRMCGKKIKGGITSNQDILLHEMTMYCVTGKFQNEMLGELSSHYCDDGNYGVCDFIGFTRGDNYNEGEFSR